MALKLSVKQVSFYTQLSVFLPQVKFLMLDLEFSAGHVRFYFAIMVCIANMLIYALKVNMPIAIIGMMKPLNKTEVNLTLACPALDLEQSSKPKYIDETFDWDAGVAGMMKGIYFAGYLIGMFPSGYFSDRYEDFPFSFIPKCGFCLTFDNFSRLFLLTLIISQLLYFHWSYDLCTA